MNVLDLGRNAIKKRPDLFGGQSPLSVGRELKRRFPDEYADIVAIDAPTRASLGVPERPKTPARGPSRTALLRPTPRPAPAPEPAALVPPPELVDQQTAQSAEGFVQGVKAGVKLGERGPSRAMLGATMPQAGAAQPERQSYPRVREMAEVGPAEIGLGIAKQLGTPGGIRESFDEGSRDLDKGIRIISDRLRDEREVTPGKLDYSRILLGGSIPPSKDPSGERVGPPLTPQAVARRMHNARWPPAPPRDEFGRFIGAPKESIDEGAVRVVRGLGGMSAVLIGPGMLAGAGSAVARAGLRGLAKFAGVAGSAIAADPIITEGTKDVLEEMGVSPSKASLAGELAGFVLEPAGIAAGVKLAVSKAKAAAKTAAKPKAEGLVNKIDVPPDLRRPPEPVTRRAPDLEAKRKDFDARVAEILREPVPPKTREQRRAKLGEALGRPDPIPADPLPSNLEPFAKELGLDPGKVTTAERQVLGELYRERQAEAQRAAEQPRRDFEAAQERRERRERNEKARQGIAEIEARKAARLAAQAPKPPPKPEPKKRVTLAKPEPKTPVKLAATPLLDAVPPIEQKAKPLQSKDGHPERSGFPAGPSGSARVAAPGARGGEAPGRAATRPDPAPASAPAAGVRPAPPSAQPSQPVAAPARAAVRSKAKTQSFEVESAFEIVEADDLITSNLDNLSEADPRFPAELQPRDRSRKASEDQIGRIERGLDPELLGDNPLASDGAPIVGPDGVVESGNARTIAVRRAYRKGLDSAGGYRAYLEANAERFGLDPEAVRKSKQPVLVRRRLSEMDPAERRAFVGEANQPSVARMGAAEQAKADAGKLSDDLLQSFHPDEETGDLTGAKNRDFLRGFVQSVVGETDRGSVLDAEGLLSQDGIRRVRNAVFARAYGDSPALARMAESADDNAKNITGGLLRAAPAHVQLKAAIDAGTRHPLGIEAELSDALQTISSLRDQRASVADWLAQRPMFGERNPLTDALVRMFDAQKRSAKKIGDILTEYTKAADAAGDPNQMGLFGKADPPTRTELLETAIRRAEEANAPLFAGEGPRSESGRPGGGRTDAQPDAPQARAEPGPAAAPRGRREAAGGDAPAKHVSARGDSTHPFFVTDDHGVPTWSTHRTLDAMRPSAQKVANLRKKAVHLYDTDGNFIETFRPEPPRPKRAGQKVPLGLTPAKRGERGAIVLRKVGPERAAIVRPGPTPPPAPRPQLGGRIRAAARAMAERASRARAQAGPATLTARTQLIDATAPIQDFVKAARSKGLPADLDPGVLARLFPGVYGRAENRIAYLDDLLAPARKHYADLAEHMVYERFDELAERGVTQFPGGQTGAEVKAERARLQQRLNADPAKKKIIETAAANLRAFTGQVLREARDEGIIGDEAYRNIRANNQMYVPLQRIGFHAEDIDTPIGPRRFSVASQDVVASIVGSGREIIDPLESIVRNVYKTQHLTQRNRVARAMAKLADNTDYAGLVVPLKDAADAPRGMEVISYFEGGKVRKFAVPNVVGESMKGLGKRHADLVTKVASWGASMLRQGATGLNVAFIPSNAIRDFQTLGITQGTGLVDTAAIWAQGMGEVIGQGRYFREWLEYGGSFSGFFETMRGPQREAKQLLRSPAARVARVVANPLELIRRASEIVEQAPRVGAFKRARTTLGQHPEAAALTSRNATVDFARSGTVLRLANMWIPFLNARLQGNLNIFKAFKEHPTRTLLASGSLVVVPAIATHLWNQSQFSDVLDDIPDWEKETYFLLIGGREQDATGRYTQVVKFPKGDVGKVLGSTLQNSLDYLQARDYTAWQSLALQVLSDVSPVSFERDGEFSGQRALSDVLPPTVKAGAELSTNSDFFRGRAIVPKALEDAAPAEQYRADTPAAAVTIGQALGVSPLKVQHAMRAQFAGVGEQALQLASGKPSGVGRTITRRFSGAQSGAVEDRLFGELDDLKQGVATLRVRAQRDAERLMGEMLDAPGPERPGIMRTRLRELRAADPDHAERVFVALEADAQRRTLTPYERSLKGAAVTVRADVISSRVRELPPAERGRYLAAMEAKGILSAAVQAELLKRARAVQAAPAR